MEKVTYEIKQLNHAIGRRLFEMHSMSGVNMPPSPLQMEIISILLDREGQDVFLKNIQEELNISKAAVSDAIDKMENKEWIQKCSFEEDARKTKIVLLPKGKELFLELEGNMQSVNEELIQNLSKEELESFFHVIHKMQKNLKEEDV